MSVSMVNGVLGADGPEGDNETPVFKCVARFTYRKQLRRL